MQATFRRTMIIAGLTLLVASTLGAEPPRTWRLDYFHTGGPKGEIFAVDRVVVEPLPWPGHPDGNLDPSGAGKYRFEVLDGEDRILYSRGFASIYGEWETTAEAAEIHRTFHESVRFPDPGQEVEVVISQRDPQNDFREIWRTTVDPSSIFVDPSSPPALEALAIEVHGDPADKVDLLMLGDGYTAAECEGKFRSDAERMAADLFAVEPFRTRRKDFNVWGLCPPAEVSGVSRPSTGIHVRSPVGATYDAFSSERYVLTFDNRAMRDWASFAPYEFVEILVNHDTYGGGGILNLFATVAVDNDFADYLFVHEFGHHFAGLADEYYTSDVAYEAPQTIVEPWEANATALLDPENLKWGHLVADETPVPTPWPKAVFEAHSREYQAERRRIRAANRPESEMSKLFRDLQVWEAELFGAAEYGDAVGAFEGANYEAEGFYRAQIDCIMFSRNEVPFCAPCHTAIERVIDLYAPPSR